MIVKAVGWDGKLITEEEFSSVRGALEFLTMCQDEGLFGGKEGNHMVKTIVLYEIGKKDEVIQ